MVDLVVINVGSSNKNQAGNPKVFPVTYMPLNTFGFVKHEYQATVYKGSIQANTLPDC